jgi:outer membrane protein, multidrug efflux system
MRWSHALALFTSLLPLPAVAQPGPGVPPKPAPAVPPKPVPAPKVAPAVPPGAPAAPATPVPPTPAQAAEPQLPEINDPMLVPVPPPKNVLSSWQQALQLARSRNSSLQIAKSQADLARAQARVSLAESLPGLLGKGGIQHHLLRGERANLFPPPPTVTVPDPATTWQAGLELSVPVFAPQSWYDYGTAKQNERALRLSTKETERIVLGTIATQIVEVVTAERLSEVSRVSLRSALSTNDLTSKRQRLGAGTMLDVLRTEQEVELARAQVVSADEALRRSRESLGLALGSSEAWGLRPDIRLDTLGADARSSCRPEPNVNSRPDVRAAQASVVVADRNVSSINRAYLPTVNFVSSLYYLSHDEISPNNEHVTWTIGGVLQWVLYDGGARYGTKEANKRQATIVREQLAETKRNASIEVTQAMRGIEVSEANLKVSRRSRDIAKETARLSRVAYENGTGTSFDLVDTGRRLREAELDLAIKEFDVLRARISALLALATCDV